MYSPRPARALAAAAVPFLLVSLIETGSAAVIYRDDFSDGKLTGWEVDVSPSGAAVSEEQGRLNIFAAANAFAHIERSNTHNNIISIVKVRVNDPNTGDLWAPGLIFYWDAGNWARIAIDGASKTITACYMLDGKPILESSQVLNAKELYGIYYRLALRLTPSHIDALYSTTGGVWTRLQYHARSGALTGAPERIILGKGYGTGNRPYHNPGLDNDSAILEGLGTAAMDDFIIMQDETLDEGPFLRKFPFPYKSALTIASDIDATSREEFLAIHQFLNTKQDMSLNQTDDGTRVLGTGIGLEIGDSFWMYNNRADPVADGLSYFDGLTEQLSPDADLIRTFFHAGYIDFIHTFGNFSNTGGFTREMAIEALEEMDRAEIRPFVWVNHGDEYNHGNIGHEWREANRGDSPGSEEYHTDLSVFPEGPIRYVWQSGAGGLVDQPVTDPISAMDLYDGKKALSFARYYGPGWTTEELGEQLSEENLADLVVRESYMILANHLNAKDGPVPQYFDSPAREALRRLETLHRGGRVYVTTSSKLLRFKTMRDHLKWTWSGGCDSTLIIEISGAVDPLGGHLVPTIAELQGISICVPCTSRVKVLLAGQDVTPLLDIFPDDGVGMPTIAFPRTHLPPMPEWTSDGYTTKLESYEVPLYDYEICVTNAGDKPHQTMLKYIGLHPFDIAAVMQNDLYHIFVPDSVTVVLPLLDPSETTNSIRIMNGTYSKEVPRLTDVRCDSCFIEQAVYEPREHMTSIALHGAGIAELDFMNCCSPFMGASCDISSDHKMCVSVGLNGSTSIECVGMAVTPDEGSSKVVVDSWEVASGTHLKWHQICGPTTRSVSYRLRGLRAGVWHSVRTEARQIGLYQSAADGELSFTCRADMPDMILEMTDLTESNRREFWLASCAPNPFSVSSQGVARSFFALAEAGRTIVRVFDAGGRLVAVLLDVPMDPGIHAIEWNGRDAHGEVVPPGVYFCGLESAGNSAARKVIVVP